MNKAEIAKRIQENRAQQQAVERELEAKERAALQMKLFPNWPDDRRGAPKQVIRSAIFGTVQRGKPNRVVDMPIASPEGTAVTITGWRLDQHDCDVWLEVMHLARRTTAGTQIRFSLHSMLKRLGQTTDGEAYDRLKLRLKHLMETSLSYDSPEVTVGVGSLILRYRIDNKSGEAVVTTNPELRGLWESVSWLDVEQRRSLGANQLAKALHAMLASLPDWPPMRLDTLMQRVGANYKRPQAFKGKLKLVLDGFRARGWIRSYTIGKGDGGLVEIDKVPTPSQARALESRPVNS